MAILRRSTTEKNNESECVRNSSSKGVRVPDVSIQIKKKVFNDNLQPFNVQKPAVKHQVMSKYVDTCTSKAQLGKPSHIKAGTKPPIKPKPELKNKHEDYVYVVEGTGVYESMNKYY